MEELIRAWHIGKYGEIFAGRCDEAGIQYILDLTGEKDGRECIDSLFEEISQEEMDVERDWIDGEGNKTRTTYRKDPDPRDQPSPVISAPVAQPPFAPFVLARLQTLPFTSTSRIACTASCTTGCRKSFCSIKTAFISIAFKLTFCSWFFLLFGVMVSLSFHWVFQHTPVATMTRFFLQNF